MENSPVDNENRILDVTEKRIYRKISHYVICMVSCVLICLKVKHAFSIVTFAVGIVFLIVGIYLFSATSWRNISIAILSISLILFVVTIFLLEWNKDRRGL